MRQPPLVAATLLAAGIVMAAAAQPRSGPGPASPARVAAPTGATPGALQAGTGPGWVIGPASQYRLPPPPDAAATRQEIEVVRSLGADRDPAALARIRYWDTGAPSYRWNQILIDEMVRRGVPANLAYRNLSVLHVALSDAIAAAWDSKYAHRRPHPSEVDAGLRPAIPTPRSPSYPAEHAVAAGAASAVLATLFPPQAAAFRTMGEAAAQSRLVAGVAFPSDVAAGLELGRRIAAEVLARAATDGSSAPWTGTVPTGPGLWSGTNPVLPQAGTWRPWLLRAPDEFRPAPPLAHDSPERRAELAELRGFPRTPKSNADAGFWEYAVGGLRQYQFWGGHLGRLTLEARQDADAPQVARAFALTYVALADAGIACWDAKYAYWTLRPSQLDPELRTVFPVPNHPSYPAAHACYSVTAATVIGFLYPDEAPALAALAQESGESRIWAGIHYRSDIVAGTALARAVSARAIARARADGP